MANGVIKKDLGYNYLLPKYFAFPHNFSSLNEEEIGTITINDINEPGCYLFYCFYPWSTGTPTELKLTINNIEMASSASLINDAIECDCMFFNNSGNTATMKIYGKNNNISGKTTIKVFMYKLPTY